jgi:hypothetical protein
MEVYRSKVLYAIGVKSVTFKLTLKFAFSQGTYINQMLEHLVEFSNLMLLTCNDTPSPPGC